jgi:hypothetical protein
VDNVRTGSIISRMFGDSNQIPKEQREMAPGMSQAGFLSCGGTEAFDVFAQHGMPEIVGLDDPGAPTAGCRAPAKTSPLTSALLQCKLSAS